MSAKVVIAAAMARMAIAAYMATAKGGNNKQRGVVYVCCVLFYERWLLRGRCG